MRLYTDSAALHRSLREHSLDRLLLLCERERFGGSVHGPRKIDPSISSIYSKHTRFIAFTKHHTPSRAQVPNCNLNPLFLYAPVMKAGTLSRGSARTPPSRLARGNRASGGRGAARPPLGTCSRPLDTPPSCRTQSFRSFRF